MNRGDRLRLTVERPAAGGRMIARHDGAIVFVSGAIPGEIVEAEIEKIQRGTAWAITKTVLQPSPDRVDGAPDGACGGSVLAHIAYERQLALKAAIVEDTLRRLGRITLEAPVEVIGSPIDGYRMRARLHMRNGKIGFFREGTHSLCDARATRQLRDDAMEAMAELERALAVLERPTVAEIELAENVDASERAVHFELAADADPSRLATLTRVRGLSGATCAPAGHPRTMDLWGSPFVTDRVRGATLARHARSFFQGNRFLLDPLVDHVLGAIGAAPILDLYAGVGLFSVAAAAAGKGRVTAVEGDAFSAADLQRNATGHGITVAVGAVEAFLSRTPGKAATVIVDPPRTGMSKEATAGVVALRAPRLVYVSCDIATLARDARILLDAGCRIDRVTAFDLFPNTAHVETIIVFSR
ncbi:MAG TPA: TRAM domain-containing protein [Vicinamibacterales bacterium]|nr:TRAM domain-containing protein [Vicinamibacterales bacterium]